VTYYSEVAKVIIFPANRQKKSAKSSAWLKIWRMVCVESDVSTSSFALQMLIFQVVGFLDEPSVTLWDAERQIL
jgi:hypothetical protein